MQEEQPILRRPYQKYYHIPQPTTLELMSGVHIWDQIAGLANINYAFGSSVAAILNGGAHQVYELEIVVEPSATPRVLTNVMYRFPEYLVITETGHNIVVTGRNRGIAMNFVRLGEKGYPYNFILPYDSPDRPFEHRDWEPTIRFKHLACFQPERRVPVFMTGLLLFLSLTEFYDTRVENRRAGLINDIRVFLYSFCELDKPFPEDQAANIQPIVKYFIRYAEGQGVFTTIDDVWQWWKWGILLAYEDVSERCRVAIAIPVPSW